MGRVHTLVVMNPSLTPKFGSDPGTFDPSRHSVLVERSKMVCARAGIPEKVLFRTYSNYATDGEIRFIKGGGEHNEVAIYQGFDDVYIRFQLLTAVYLRNMHDAVFAPVDTLIDTYEPCTALLIPDFDQPSMQRDFSAPKVRAIIDTHLTRAGAVLYLGLNDINAPASYGGGFWNHLRDSAVHFRGK